MGHKKDKPCMINVAQHLQELWKGMGKILETENWPDVSRKLKSLLHLIQAYAGLISSQAERQLNLIRTTVPARSIQTASNVTLVSPLQFQSKLPSSLVTLNMKLYALDVYVPVDVNSYMEGFETWRRFALPYSNIVILALWFAMFLCCC
jgi:hypothetical protein